VPSITSPMIHQRSALKRPMTPPLRHLAAPL
jgi:hypothetical protein